MAGGWSEYRLQSEAINDPAWRESIIYRAEAPEARMELVHDAMSASLATAVLSELSGIGGKVDLNRFKPKETLEIGRGYLLFRH